VFFLRVLRLYNNYTHGSFKLLPITLLNTLFSMLSMNTKKIHILPRLALISIRLPKRVLCSKVRPLFSMIAYSFMILIRKLSCAVSLVAMKGLSSSNNRWAELCSLLRNYSKLNFLSFFLLLLSYKPRNWWRSSCLACLLFLISTRSWLVKFNLLCSFKAGGLLLIGLQMRTMGELCDTGSGSGCYLFFFFLILLTY